MSEKPKPTAKRTNTKKPKIVEITKDPGTSNAKAVLIVILAIFAIPVILPLAIALVAVVCSLIIAVFSIILAIGVSGIAMLFSSIVGIPVAIVAFTQNAPAGLAVLGSTFLLIGLGAFFLAGAIKLARITAKGLSHLINKTILRKQEA
jgi:uncharacterized membrane protein